MTRLLHKELTGTILGVYWDVYNGLSHVYPEFIYETAMAGELLREWAESPRPVTWILEPAWVLGLAVTRHEPALPRSGPDPLSHFLFSLSGEAGGMRSNPTRRGG